MGSGGAPCCHNIEHSFAWEHAGIKIHTLIPPKVLAAAAVSAYLS
jgi:hypothetical protein